jgi:hypothetical protein
LVPASEEAGSGKEQKAMLQCLLDQNMNWVKELVHLVRKDERDPVTAGGLGSKTRICEIGEQLNRNCTASPNFRTVWNSASSNGAASSPGPKTMIGSAIKLGSLNGKFGKKL